MPQVLSIIGVTYRGRRLRPRAQRLRRRPRARRRRRPGDRRRAGADRLRSASAGAAASSSTCPIGLAALALAPRLVPESRAPRRSRLDVTGALAARARPGGGAAAADRGPPARLAGVDVDLAGARAGDPRPASSPSRRGPGGAARRRCSTSACSRERAFSGGLLTQLMLASAQASFFVYLALYLQQGRGLNPLQAGLVFTILAVAYVAGLRAGADADRAPRPRRGRRRRRRAWRPGWGCSRRDRRRRRRRLACSCSCPGSSWSAPASGCASRR